MSDDAPETIWLAANTNGGGYGDHYHTDPDCRILAKATTPIDKPAELFDLDEFEECKICQGIHSGGKENTRDLSLGLEAMDPEDLGLSPLQEVEGE